MPSPFPGMDPYLEGSLWTSVHTQLAVEIARQLTPRLLPRYIPLTEQRFVMATPEAAGTALIEAPLRMATVMAEPIPHVTVEIRDVGQRRLVTAIEVLSPTNKRGEGRDEYLAKRQQLLRSDAHLMEIDLLRSGERVPMAKPLPSASYFVFLSRARRRPMTEVWPIPIAGRLPTVPVPLLPGDADVPLDLQEALSSVYDAFGYAAVLDYGGPASVPLSAADAAWAKSLIDERK